MKIINIVVFFLLFAYTGFSQGNLPNVIPPSPEAAAFFKFQDYPMDYSTGLPQISIPLYEVRSGSLSVPISISYHASGRKVNDQDGAVALGWSLDAGGLISRTVYGSADFGTPSLGTYKFPYPFKVTGLDNCTDLNYLEKIKHYDNPAANILPWTESEYDVFSYSFGNSGGKFIFKDVNNVKTPIFLPYKPYILTPYYTDRGLTGIDITDDKGTLYKFTYTETSGPDNDYAVTSLLLSQIISADKTDVITFKYTSFAEWNLSINQQRTYITDWNMYPVPAPQPEVTDNESVTHGTYQIQRLTEIDFNQGKVVFNLVSSTDKINNIQVFDLNNQIIKTIQFNRSQQDVLKQGGSALNPLANQVNNKLDALIIKDKNDNVTEKYSFEYFPTKYYGSETTVDLHYCDWWGYYNASGNLNMIPDYTLNNGIHVGNPSYNREPNLNALESGVLKKITYPTGGSVSFTYENNRYADVGNTSGSIGPGLRLSKVSTTDNNGVNTTKTYKYGVSESGYGSLDLKPDITNMASCVQYVKYGYAGYSDLPGGTYTQYTFLPNFITALSALAYRPVIYTEVTEYLGTPTNNIGKSVYKYDYYGWAPAGMPAFSQQNIIKMHISNWNFWNNPVLTDKTDYKSFISTDQTVTYSPAKELYNHYTITNLADIACLHVQELQILPQTGISTQYSVTAEAWHACNNNGKICTFSDYHIPAGIKNLDNTSETLYNDDGSTITSGTSYEYNPRQLVNKITKTNSDNSVTVTNIKYPFDYTGNSTLTQMSGTTLNMIDYPVEKIETKVSGSTSTPINSTRTNYYNYGSSVPMIYPQTIDVSKGSGSYETRLRYYGYDANGNPLSVSKENDMNISYIWDYRATYPVAEVKNAAVADIAYTSFEADGNGNWSGINAANIISDTNAITGSKSYTLTSTTLTKSGLTASNQYVVSYWSKNGQYTVSGSVVTGWPKTVRSVSINGVTWTNYEHKVTGVTSITITGSGAIDEVRLQPANAQMTTYTFNPLTGMTSQSDADNRITYYQYDPFGRLKLIRDMNWNILKTFSYQYSSTTY